MFGLLVDYGYCTGCSICEAACLNSRLSGTGSSGMQVMKLGPLKAPDGSWQFDFMPVLTDWCDLCGADGPDSPQPACCSACVYGALTFGSVDALSELMAFKSKMMLITPPAKLNHKS